MADMIKVTPQELISAAGEFGSIGGQIRNLTSEMMSTVNSLSGVWTGDAASAYTSKFRELEDDIQKMCRMVEEHSKDLEAMGQTYQAAEDENRDTGSTLQSDVIS